MIVDALGMAAAPADLPCYLTPTLCIPEIAGAAAKGAADTVLEILASAIMAGVDFAILALISWLLVPSIDLNNGTAGTLQSWLLPIAAMILVAGLTWQGLLMVIQRKGQPLFQAIKGLWTTALWGAVAVAGTAAALRAGDSYSCWILVKGLRTTDPNLGDQCSAGDVANAAILGEGTKRLKVLLLPVAPELHTPGMLIFLGLIILVIVLIQSILMVLRNGALIILTGVVQLAAAGTATRGTSAWLRKVLAWMLALVTYKPVAATVYGTAFLLIRSRDADPRTMFTGMAMLVLSVVALPAMMKFFNWGVGSVSNGEGVAGPAMTATVLAANALPRGGGSSGQAQFLDKSMPPVITQAPSGSTASAAGGATQFAPPVSAGAGATGAAGAGAGAAGGAAAGGAAAGGAAAGAAATGPAAAVVAPVLLGAAAAVAAGQAAKKAATNAMGTDEER